MEQPRERRECARGDGYYTWQEGDTLVGVAQKNGLTTSAIRQANPGMPLETVSPGTPICLPPRPPLCPSGRLYTVKRGDTLVSIARMQGIPVASLMEQNPYVDPEDLRVGQVLCLPEGEEPAPQPPVRPVGGCAPGYTRDNVRYGEDLVDILTRYNMSYAAFTGANPRLDPRRLIPGQAFCVPPRAGRGGCGDGRSYLIQDRENLQTAARANGFTARQLLETNPNLAPGDFVPGRMICLPE